MDLILAAALDNLLSPVILAFILGIFAGAVRSDLQIPEAIAKGISIYLMFAIGLKGGVSLAEAGDALAILPALVAALALSFLLPFPAYWLLRTAGGAAAITAAAVAAHYGSVSVVTFATAAQFLDGRGIAHEGHLVAMLALMETPAIVAGLLLARRHLAGADHGASQAPAHGAGGMLREVLFNGSILLLVGGFLIGWAAGSDGMAAVGPFFKAPFTGVLCLFMLDLGLLVARRSDGFGQLGPRLLAFGLYMPLIGASAGLGTAVLLGLSPGGATLLTVLAASASYIAVPAAIRMALPQANPAVYVTLSLAVTFPFNVMVGIPLYYAAAVALTG